MAHKEILDELRQPVRDLREQIPAVFQAYGALNAAVFAGGALDAKTKELITLAISVSKQCDGCIASHHPRRRSSRRQRRGDRRGAGCRHRHERWAGHCARTPRPGRIPRVRRVRVTSTPPVAAELAEQLLGATTCQGWAEQDEGPYHRAGIAVRRDVIEDRDGASLQLGVRLVGADGRPAAETEVEIWHCDALGRYSGFSSPDSSANATSRDAPHAEYLPEATWLRGRQQSDRAGMVEFRTIYPGWYPGRTVHIHLIVAAAETTYTSQLYFPDEITAALFRRAPYEQRAERDTFNATDTIFHTGGTPAVLDVVPTGAAFRAGACLVLPSGWNRLAP